MSSTDQTCEESDAPLNEQVVIDLRDEDAFRCGHLPNAAHFDGPTDLASRCAELPPPTSRHRMRAVLVADGEDNSRLAEVVLRNAGFREVVRAEHHGREMVRGPPVRLWAPSPMAVRAEGIARELPMQLTRTVLDIGCGGGRDAAYLAARGWHVTAVDRSSELLARAGRLASRRYADDANVAESGGVRLLERTFGRDRLSDERWLQEHAAALVLVVRFLRRPLLEMLHHAVLDGGLVAYEHFLDGCEAYGAPRKASQRLRHGELAKVFDSKRFEILLDEVALLDDSRPVNRFIARKVER